MNAKLLSAALFTVALLAGSAALAQDAEAPPAAPSADEVKKVNAYFTKGKGQGPILTDLKPCLKVDNNKASATKFECVEVVSGPVKKNTLVHAWTSWLVPENDKYEDVLVQFIHEGVVRNSQDVSLTGWYNTRTWKAQNLNKPGKWEIKVLRGDKTLGTVEVAVE